MGVHEPRQERVVTANDTLTRLVAGIDLLGRRDRHDSSRGHGNGVIGEYGVGGRDRQHPAGLDHQIDGVF